MVNSFSPRILASSLVAEKTPAASAETITAASDVISPLFAISSPLLLSRIISFASESAKYSPNISSIRLDSSAFNTTCVFESLSSSIIIPPPFLPF